MRTSNKQQRSKPKIRRRVGVKNSAMKVKPNCIIAILICIAFISTSPASCQTKDTTQLLGGLTYLNAYNFDFNNSLASNYVGHFALFAPSLSKDSGKFGFGFNAGIMKVAYAVTDQADSTVYNRTDYFSLNPLKSLQENNGFYGRQFNRYTVRTTSGSYWSLYAQPLLELTDMGSKHHIYVHGHFELLVNKSSYSVKVKTLSQDTTDQTPALPIQPVPSSDYSINQTTYAGYFGGGLTFYLAPWPKSHFFFQATIGRCNVTFPSVPGIVSQDGFYLFRSYYLQKLSDASTVMIGTDIRGFLPTQSPVYAAYVGLNLDLDQVVTSLLGKK